MDTPHYVGFWKRFFATVLDSLLLLCLIVPPLFYLYGWEYFQSTSLVVGPADFVISWVLPVVFVFVFWMIKQATPGKMLVGFKIVDAQTGGKPTLSQWIIRHLGYFVSTLPLGLGFLWVAFDSRKQGWHDKMAGTVVVSS